MYYGYLKNFKASKLAFIEDDSRCTYAQFIERIERCMGFLAAAGVKKGDKVAFALANHSDFLVIFYAATAMGAVAVPLNIMLKASEYKYIFDDCQPAVVIASAHLSEVFAAEPRALKSLASAPEAEQLKEVMWPKRPQAKCSVAGVLQRLFANKSSRENAASAQSDGMAGVASGGAMAAGVASGEANSAEIAAGRKIASNGHLVARRFEQINTQNAAAQTNAQNAANLSEHPLFDEYHNFERAPQLAAELERGALSHILYTSGTTGLPKGVMLSFGNLLSNIEAIQRDFRITKRDRFIAYLPMFHSFTLTAVCMLPLLVGCTLVIKRSVMPFKEVVAAIFRHRVSILFSIPAILVALQKAKLPWYFRWFNRIRIIISGGSSLAPSVLEAYEKSWRRAVLIEGYGLSECSPVVSVNKLEARKAYSVGTPLSGTQVMVVDEDFNALPPGSVGELAVSGECVMLGYLGKPEMTAEVMEGKWLRTGDIARIDEDGFIYIIDRKKDIIISKGINIYPREIEDVICAHSAVNAAAVIGEKDKQLDESVVAYVELHENEQLSASELMGFLKPRLAAFKLPKHINFLPELPKNAAGKVLKKNLKERLARGEN